MKRIAQRNRSVEETIKLDYIEELHNEYNRYFEALQSNESISTFIVNANSSHDGVYEDVLNILRPILIEKSS
jgi:deoxyadenosine/deoxycytidine kinase